MNYVWFHSQAPHCVTCRCFVVGGSATTASTLKFTIPYVPKHRKPGPAQ